MAMHSSHPDLQSLFTYNHKDPYYILLPWSSLVPPETLKDFWIGLLQKLNLNWNLISIIMHNYPCLLLLRCEHIFL